eukprot:8983215-Karenia_brevis.AAC.1
MRALFEKFPTTVCLAVSRVGCQTVNDASLAALFTKDDLLGYIDADVESDPQNYDAKGKLLPVPKLKPSCMPVYQNMMVFITRNVDKERDHVNGMQARVEDYKPRAKALYLITNTGRRVVSCPRHDAELGNLVYHPVRPGYCSTIIKYQGAELDHMTLFLDKAG